MATAKMLFFLVYRLKIAVWSTIVVFMILQKAHVSGTSFLSYIWKCQSDCEIFLILIPKKLFEV